MLPQRVFDEMRDGGAERWRRQLADPDARAHWLATDARPGSEGALVGFAVVEARGPHAPRPLRLNSLYVTAEMHGHGVGRVLLQYSIGEAPCYLWVAARNTKAQAFYRRHGFELDGGSKTFPEWDDLEDLRMVR